jgi:hypothetical protein
VEDPRPQPRDRLAAPRRRHRAALRSARHSRTDGKSSRTIRYASRKLTSATQEKWYAKNGEPQPDPKASLILSAIGLAFSIVANALLLLRFSTDDQYRRLTIMIPLTSSFWLIKVHIFLYLLHNFLIIETGYSILGEPYSLWYSHPQPTVVLLPRRLLVRVRVYSPIRSFSRH